MRQLKSYHINGGSFIFLFVLFYIFCKRKTGLVKKEYFPYYKKFLLGFTKYKDMSNRKEDASERREICRPNGRYGNKEYRTGKGKSFSRCKNNKIDS